MKSEHEIKMLSGYDRVVFLSNTIFENNLKLFADLISNKTGVAAENWLIRKCKGINGTVLLGQGFIKRLYNMGHGDCLDFVSVADEQEIDFASSIMMSVFKSDQPPFFLHQPKPPFNKIVMLDATPVGKPTWQKSDRWLDPPRKPVAKYLRFKDEVLISARQFDFVLPDIFRVTFYCPLPKSASKKKKVSLHNQYKRTKPDCSNMLKGLEDTLTETDETICDEHLIKRHTIGNSDGTGGYIIIEYGLDEK